MKIFLLNCRSCLPKIALLMGIAALYLHFASTAPTRPQPVNNMDKLIVSDGHTKVRLLIYRDELGCVLRKPEDRDRLAKQDFKKAFRVRLTLQPPKLAVNNMAIYKLSRSMKQLPRQNLIMAMKKQYKFLDEVGPVVRFSQTGRAFVLPNRLRVEFRLGTPRKIVALINRELKTEIVRPHRTQNHIFIVRVKDLTVTSLLDVVRKYQKHRQVRYVGVDLYLPNTSPVRTRGQPPLVQVKCQQWHHANNGAQQTCPDADIDTVEAWKITKGTPEVIIAIIDAGFHVTHPGLRENLWTNPREIAGDNKDNDGNGLPDDLHGWDFKEHDPVVEGSEHGTWVAGCAAGCDRNGHGLCGVCPRGRLMLLRARRYLQVVDAFEYAVDHGASIINRSAQTPRLPKIVAVLRRAITEGRCGHGCVITSAMDYRPPDDLDECSDPQYLSGNRHVLSVGWCDQWDRKHHNPKRRRPFGRCLSLLAPGFDIITTAEPNTSEGACPKGYRAVPPGTSMSAPLTAGVAGLVLSACPKLTWEQVKHLVQDTCDKIDPELAQYTLEQGRSSPQGQPCTHGFGRLNAFEAVRTVAPATKKPGRGGFDLLIRDNALDWGNTEKASSVFFQPSKRDFIPYWESVDIKVDCEPFQPVPHTSRAFDRRLKQENPTANKTCRVYVRVRNRGPFTARDVKVHLCATPWATLLPAFPEVFWQGKQLPDGTPSVWHYIGQQTIEKLPYSGPSVAGTSRDQAAIVCFEWKVPANGSSGSSLLAFADCEQDPLAATGGDLPAIVPFNNNVALRSVFVANTHNTHKAECPFQLRGPAGTPSVLKFRHPDWKLTGLPDVSTNSVTVAGGTNQKVTLTVQTPRRGTTGRVRMIQKKQHNGEWIPIGGLTLQLVSHR